MKLGRCIRELERIYGIQHGGAHGNQYYNVAKPNNSALATQEELANIIGLSVDTIQNYKKLTEIIPEVEELLCTGMVSPTVAVGMVKTMTPEEQEKFISQMDVTKKITGRQVQQYIEQLKRSKQEVAAKEKDIRELRQEIQELERIYDIHPGNGFYGNRFVESGNNFRTLNQTQAEPLFKPVKTQEQICGICEGSLKNYRRIRQLINLNQSDIAAIPVRGLEWIYGIKNGGTRGNQYYNVADPNNSVLADQEQFPICAILSWM